MARVKLNLAGFRALRLDAQEDLHKRGEKLAAACGDGFELEDSPSKARARVTVFAKSTEAMIQERRDTSLLKNLGAAK